jgi:hypothetical protein
MDRLLRNLKTPIGVKEHGAWAIVFIPLCTGALLARVFTFNALLLLIAELFFFLAYRPVELLVQLRKNRSAHEKRLHAWFWAALYSLVALIAAGILLVNGRYYLLAFGGVTALLFGIGMQLQKKNRLSQSRELLGILGLSLGAPAMLYSITGEVLIAGWRLWILNALFFFSSSFFIHLKLSEKNRGDDAVMSPAYLKQFRLNIVYQSSLLLGLIVLSVSHLLTLWGLLAFLPMLWHCLSAARVSAGKADFKKTGIIFLAYSLFFGALISL